MFGVCLPLDLVQDLSRLRVTQILGKVNFFNDLTKKQREQLSAIMDVLYFNYDDVVFGEGEIGNKFYILIEGDFPTAFRSSGWMWLDGMCVCMRHTTSSLPACRTANCRLSCCRVAVPNCHTAGRVEMHRYRPSGGVAVLATYATYDERPWFGELALWSTKPRCRANHARAGWFALRCYTSRCYTSRCYTSCCYTSRCYTSRCYTSRCYTSRCYTSRCPAVVPMCCPVPRAATAVCCEPTKVLVVQAEHLQV